MSADSSGAKPTVVFRLRCGGAFGWGHLARCGALAAELQSRGASCQLWGDQIPESAPADFGAVFDCHHVFVDQPKADWVVVDDLGANDDFLRDLRKLLDSSGARMLVIDDDGKRSIDAADLILNTRLGLRKSPYAPKVTALLGEEYALLRPGLNKPAAVVSGFPEQVEAVLVMLGGTDPRGLTADVLHGLADVGTGTIAPVVVVSKSGRGAEDISAALARFAQSAWLESVDATTLAGWAANAKFAISAAGGTLLELAVLRVPFVSIVVADNQKPLARQARETWGMPFIDGASDIRSAVTQVVGSLPDPSQFNPEIDSLGASRVASCMEEMAVRASS
jgi:spore coat polysaccharide biosynthesis predicted glycosyltransferase SpsG